MPRRGESSEDPLEAPRGPSHPGEGTFSTTGSTADSQTGSQPRTFSPGGSRLLVVEDHQQIRHYMRGSLESAGYEVAEASRGLGALELLKTCPCDLILSDYVLLDMTGVDLYHRTGTLDPRFLTRFIMTTGALFCPEIETFQRTCPIRILFKPFLSEEMIQVVGDVLDRDRLTPPLF